MTRASEEMARGRYDQSIPVRRRDEVGRLANAFNAMAQQVSSSDRTMRDFLANVSPRAQDAADLDPGVLAGADRRDDAGRRRATSTRPGSSTKKPTRCAVWSTTC